MQLLSAMTLYFGYGSNLWLEQMRLRCPGSEYLGVARLDNFTWIIKEPGYANVIASNLSSDSTAPSHLQLRLEQADPESQIIISTKSAATDYDNQVYGLLYSLTPTDEKRLDENEGVASGAYTKEYLPVNIWRSTGQTDGYPNRVDVDGPPNATNEKVLVYIDRRRILPVEPRTEYIDRMNHGIHDALALGVPQAYVDQVMRKFIPPPLVEKINSRQWSSHDKS